MGECQNKFRLLTETSRLRKATEVYFNTNETRHIYSPCRKSIVDPVQFLKKKKKKNVFNQFWLGLFCFDWIHLIKIDFISFWLAILHFDRPYFILFVSLTFWLALFHFHWPSSIFDRHYFILIVSLAFWSAPFHFYSSILIGPIRFLLVLLHFNWKIFLL